MLTLSVFVEVDGVATLGKEAGFQGANKTTTNNHNLHAVLWEG